MSNFYKRTVSVILVFVLCFGLVVPAQAESISDSDDIFYNVLDFATILPSGSNLVTFNNSITLDVDIQGEYIFSYADLLLSWQGPDITSVQIGYNGSFLTLNQVEIGYKVYRFYGEISSKVYDRVQIIINTGSSSDTSVNFHSFKLYRRGYAQYPSIAGIWSNRGSSTGVTMKPSPDESVTVKYDISNAVNTQHLDDYRTYIYLTEWRKYDYIDINVETSCATIDSIQAYFDTDQSNIPIEVTYINPNAPNSSYGSWLSYTGSVEFGEYDLHEYGYTTLRFFTVRVDLSRLDRSRDGTVMIRFSGSYSTTNDVSYFTLGKVFGFLNLIPIDADLAWYNKIWLTISNGFTNLVSNLSSWFSTTFNKLDSIINILDGHSAAADQAHQTQEEVNVSINNQLVGAVEDWNTNITVVETGYDLAVSKTTPVLVWLSSLADGIFNGMGWFGNVYFLVGLISVIMLVLSKSGLAHKIGSINRRKGG